MLGTGCLPKLGNPAAEPRELIELVRGGPCGRELEEVSSGVRRRFEVGGVIKPDRKDWAEAGATREGVWLREALLLELPARLEAAFSRPLRQLPKAAASCTALGDAKFESVESVGKDC